jgi:hypothetical protein
MDCASGTQNVPSKHSNKSVLCLWSFLCGWSVLLLFTWMVRLRSVSSQCLCVSVFVCGVLERQISESYIGECTRTDDTQSWDG